MRTDLALLWPTTVYDEGISIRVSTGISCCPMQFLRTTGEHGMCRGFLVPPWSLSVGAPFAPNSSGFLPNYFGLYSEPIFEVVTDFTAPFLVKLIRTYPN